MDPTQLWRKTWTNTSPTSINGAIRIATYINIPLKFHFIIHDKLRDENAYLNKEYNEHHIYIIESFANSHAAISMA